ncbi:MAG: putative toxin-antitoxin system toxin component, PIN family [Cyanophyceae cyanobacterium]
MLDTNILVSALLNARSVPAQVFNLVQNDQVQAYSDVRILDEYRSVLLRPKFGFARSLVDGALFHFEEFIVSPPPLTESLPDEDDHPFLEVALHVEAGYLVTGNLAHFPKEKCAPVKPISPREFLDIFRNS